MRNLFKRLRNVNRVFGESVRDTYTGETVEIYFENGTGRIRIIGGEDHGKEVSNLNGLLIEESEDYTLDTYVEYKFDDERPMVMTTGKDEMIEVFIEGEPGNKQAILMW